MFKWLVSLLVFGSLVTSALAEESFIVRFDLTESMKHYLKANEFDITGVNYDTQEIEALLSPDEFARIKAQKTTIRFAYPQNLSAAPDEEYKNPAEIQAFLENIHARFPEITKLHSIGTTLEGRKIWAIKISDNADLDESEPVLLVNGMHHAREVMTPEITTDMVEFLVTHYHERSDVTKWIENSEIWIIPMFNLDGNNKMWNENSMWRKNTRNGHGVDLNRNYPAGWNSCNGPSSNVNAQDYRGTAPGSEPETRAMMEFVAAIKPVFNISYHSYSEIVIYPFGCSPLRTPANEAVEEIGAQIGKKIDYRPGTAWELLYNADGGDIDWMYTQHQVIPYVIEVNSTMQGFHPSYKRWRDKTVERNRPGWMHLLERLEGPGIHGRVSTRDYGMIKVFQKGSNKAFQEYRINQDGSFYIILKQGEYDLAFEGLKTMRLPGVVVKQKTILNL